MRQMEPPANPGDSPVELELTVESVESVSYLLKIGHLTGRLFIELNAQTELL